MRQAPPPEIGPRTRYTVRAADGTEFEVRWVDAASDTFQHTVIVPTLGPTLLPQPVSEDTVYQVCTVVRRELTARDTGRPIGRWGLCACGILWGPRALWALWDADLTIIAHAAEALGLLLEPALDAMASAEEGAPIDWRPDEVLPEDHWGHR